MQISPTDKPELDRWIARLNAGAAGALAALPLGRDEPARAAFAEQFSDEYGNRARTSEPFLRHLLDLGGEPPSTPGDLDELLWWQLCGDSANPADPSQLLAHSPNLTARSDDMAIEHWTQVELCALHALWTFNQRACCDEIGARVRDAGVWIMHELQPDNAINRPWGMPVFVMLSLTLGDASDRAMASMYAQTLLHNCSITMGRPDFLSSCILLQSVRMLRLVD